MRLRPYRYHRIDENEYVEMEEMEGENVGAMSSKKKKLLFATICALFVACFVTLMLLYALFKWPKWLSTSDEWVNHFSTKTAYRNQDYRVSRHLIDRAHESLEESRCRPIHVTAVYRHGSRNPSEKQIRHAMELHQRFVNESSIHEYLPTKFVDWVSAFPLGTGNNLTEEGRSEQQGLGRRMKRMWGTRIQQPCHHSKVKCQKFPPPRSSFNINNTQFFSSYTSRTIESGQNFIVGLLDDEVINNVTVAEKLIQIDNTHMRFFETCAAYVSKVKHNKTIRKKLHEFDNSEHVVKILHGVRQKFHLPEHFKFSIEDVDVMLVMCASEVIIRRQSDSRDTFTKIHYPSPWCAFFTDEDRRVWEYKQDLKNYWIKSYPYNISYIPSCILLDRMREFLVNAMTKNRAPNQTDLRGTFYFGHAETMIPLLTVLGFFKDKEELTAFNYEQNRNRKFRTAALSPMAVNLAFVLHQCAPFHDPHSEGDYEYRLQAYLNELPLKWPSFSDRTDISMKEFLHHYSFCWSKSFNFNQTCIVT